MVTVKVIGGPALHRSLQGLTGNLRDLSSVNAEVARDLVAAVSSRAPRDTGRLAGSFHASGSREKAEASSSLVYAPVQNYGSPGHNIEGRHFAEAALTSSTGAAEAKYRKGIGQLCRKAEA